jgi:hypothetical protein
MKSWFAFLICWLPLAVAAQSPAPVDMASEPHHRLLKNDQVRVFSVTIPPREQSWVRHEHNFLTVTLDDEWPASRNDAAIASELVIAISDLDFKIPDQARIHKAKGDIWWLPEGRKARMFNDGGAPGHFVLVELKSAK